jgi:hypothetical protein
MNATGAIILALVLTTFGVAFFWYIWVKVFGWELAIWYRAIVHRRKEEEIEAIVADMEMGKSVAGGSEAGSKKSGGEGGSKSGSKKGSEHGSKKSGEGGGSKAPSKHGSKKSGGECGSKAPSKKSGSKSGGGSKHDSRSGSKA